MLSQWNLHCNACWMCFEPLWKTTCANKHTHARLSEMLWPSGGGWLDQQGLAALPRALPKNYLRWRPGTLSYHAICTCKAFQAAGVISSLKLHYYHVAQQTESWLWVSQSIANWIKGRPAASYRKYSITNCLCDKQQRKEVCTFRTEGNRTGSAFMEAAHLPLTEKQYASKKSGQQ